MREGNARMTVRPTGLLSPRSGTRIPVPGSDLCAVIPGPRALGSALRAVRAQAPRAQPGTHNHRFCRCDIARPPPLWGYGFRARWQVGKADLPAPRNDAEE